jgi:hypothetical protein
MEFNSLKANFVEEFFLLDRLVFKHAGVIPTIGGHPITGSIICDMVVKYLDSIKMRSGMLSAISEIPTQAQLIAKMAAERAIKTAKEKYDHGMQGVQTKLPLPLGVVHQQHLRCLADAETTLIDMAIGVEEADRLLLLHDLRQFVAEEESLLSFRPDVAIFVNESMLKGGLLRILQRNEELSSQATSDLFSTLYDPIGKGCREEPCAYASVEAFDAAVAALKVSLLQESRKQGVEAAMVHLLESNPRVVKDRETIIFSGFDAKLQDMRQQHAQDIELLKTEMSNKVSHLNAAMVKETSERSKGLLKAADECSKLRAEFEGHNKAHGATVTEIRDKINTVKTEAKVALDTVEKDFNEKLSSCAGNLESAKAELTKNVDAKVDALEEKIQGLKKGAEDLEEDIGKTLTQVKDGAERALGAAKGALLEALETHKTESLKALQTAKTELTKEREEAEGKTTAAREALGTAIRYKFSPVLYCAFVWYMY